MRRDQQQTGNVIQQVSGPANSDDLPEPTGLDSPEILKTLGEVPTDGLGGAKVWLGELQRTQGELADQPKVRVMLPQRPPGHKQGMEPPKTVQINDLTFKIPRGQVVEVPAEVARILEESGALYAL